MLTNTSTYRTFSGILDWENRISIGELMARLAKMKLIAEQRTDEKRKKLTLLYRMRKRDDLLQSYRDNWVRGRLHWFSQENFLKRSQIELQLRDRLGTAAERWQDENALWTPFDPTPAALPKPAPYQEHLSLPGPRDAAEKAAIEWLKKYQLVLDEAEDETVEVSAELQTGEYPRYLQPSHERFPDLQVRHA